MGKIQIKIQMLPNSILNLEENKKMEFIETNIKCFLDILNMNNNLIKIDKICTD